MINSIKDIARQMLHLRISQLLVNEKIKNNEFKIPIHLALGHEAIAVCIDRIMKKEDALLLTHRNIHYNIARLHSIKEILAEYYLKGTGLSNGKQGSMNLSNPTANIVYTSNILGNNQSVGSGYALGNKIRANNGVVFTITGDGAIEEGSFYESLLFQKTNNLSIVTIVENNRWSLATEIQERRCEINLKKLVGGLDIGYYRLKGNNVYNYIEQFKIIRKKSLFSKSPICVEIDLTSLGFWIKKENADPKGRYVNYHSGAIPFFELLDYPIILKTNQDPLYVLEKIIAKDKLIKISKSIKAKLESELL